MTFEEFLPGYLAAHSKPQTRVAHAAGTLTGLGVAAYGIVKGKPRMLLVALAAGYIPAWLSHWFIEHNRPKTFGYPLFALRGDFVMLGQTLRGRLTSR